jgi:carbonic anhydrase
VFRNGDKSAGESHFVYKNDETQQMAVFSFLMESRISQKQYEDPKSDAATESEWQKYFKVAQELKNTNDSMSINLILTSLMGKNLKDYWRYDGSLTTPPCSETVTWTVFKDPITILDFDFDSFRHDLFYESYRGPQPLYYRDVYRTFDEQIVSPIPDQNRCINVKSNDGSTIFNSKNIFASFFFFISNLLFINNFL